MKRLEGLSRIEPSTDMRGGGWRILVSRHGRNFSTKFFDSMYDNPFHARQAAEAFLCELMKLLPTAHAFQRVGADGLPGSVTLVEGTHPHWRALLTVDKRRHTKIFTVAKYGNGIACRLALEIREQWLRKAGFFDRKELPTPEEIADLSGRIRLEFDERKSYRRRGQFHTADDYGLIRRKPDIRGKGGFWVVNIIRNGVCYRRQFTDSNYADEKDAREAALQYRNEILANAPAMSRRERQQILTSRNSTGAVGVHAQRKNGELRGWYAQIDVRGKVYSRFFGANKYGAEHAYQLAVQARQQMLEMVDGDCTISPAGRRLSVLYQSIPAKR